MDGPHNPYAPPKAPTSDAVHPSIVITYPLPGPSRGRMALHWGLPLLLLFVPLVNLVVFAHLLIVGAIAGVQWFLFTLAGIRVVSVGIGPRPALFTWTMGPLFWNSSLLSSTTWVAADAAHPNHNHIQALGRVIGVLLALTIAGLALASVWGQHDAPVSQIGLMFAALWAAVSHAASPRRGSAPGIFALEEVEARLHQNDIGAACDVWERAQEQGIDMPGEADALARHLWAGAARTHLLTGLEQALECVAEGRRRGGTDPTLDLIEATALTDLLRVDEAHAALERVAEQRDQLIPAFADSLLISKAKNDYNRLMPRLEQAIEVDGDLDRAEEMIREQLDPLEKGGDIHAAMKRQQLEPIWMEIRTGLRSNLAHVFSRRGAIDDARRLWDDVLECTPKDSPLQPLRLSNAAWGALFSGHTPRALALSEAAVGLLDATPSSAITPVQRRAILSTRGSALVLGGLPEEAMALLTEALESMQGKDRAVLLATMALAQLRLGKPNRAAQRWAEAESVGTDGVPEIRWLLDNTDLGTIAAST